MTILNYFFIGSFFTFLVDILINYKPVKNHVKMKDKTWGWYERIICILFWPIASSVFFISFLKTYFR